MAGKVQSWVSEVSALAQVAASRPHAAYSAFTHGLIGRWVYLMRAVPDISSFFQPLEDAIRLQLFPSISGHPACSATELDLFSLPCCFGGLGLINPMLTMYAWLNLVALTLENWKAKRVQQRKLT